MCNGRDFLKDKKRIVVKIGSSSLMHSETGKLDLLKIERLVRALVDIKKFRKRSNTCFIRCNCSWKNSHRASRKT